MLHNNIKQFQDNFEISGISGQLGALVAQHHRRMNEPQPQGIYTPNFVQIGPAVPKTCSRTDRHINRQTDVEIDDNDEIAYFTVR